MNLPFFSGFWNVFRFAIQADGGRFNAVRADGDRRVKGGPGRRRVAPGGGHADARGGQGHGAGHESVARPTVWNVKGMS